MVRGSIGTMGLALGLMACAVVPCGAQAGPAGDPAKGEAIANGGIAGGVPACGGCHGAAGEGQPGAGIPRLAGLSKDYLDHELVSFANGTRENDVMGPMAGRMDAATMADVAAYYAGLAPPKAPDPGGPKPELARGETLALRGDWGARVPACASCHGAHGLGVGAAFPAIAGQSASYITAELNAWKAGTRHDDPLGLMAAVAGRLDDDQVAAVAAYYASLPAARATEEKP